MYLFVRRYAPFSTFGGGFEGDVRTQATTSPTATARTVGVVEFGPRAIRGYRSFSDGTQFLAAGPWLASKIGKKFSNVRAEVTNISINSKAISFTVFTAGANPLVPGAPDIDTYVDFKATFFTEGNTLYGGTIRGDSFPNAEVFIIEENGRQVLLFDFRTTGGRDTGPLRLIGEHAGVVLGTFSVRVPAVGPLAPVPAVAL